MSSEKEKLDDLSERIRLAEEGTKPKPVDESRFSRRNAGYDFAGSVLGGVVLGVLLDRAFETAPWFLVIMVVMGFISGIMGVWGTIKKSQNKDKG